MVSIELTEKEVEQIIKIIESSSVQIIFVEEALVLYKKFKES